jgi:muramoyltetrapeptide carboxypeptidase
LTSVFVSGAVANKRGQGGSIWVRMSWAEALRRLGFEPVPADNLLSRHGLFAGSDAERLAAFHRLAADPSLRAILFARGGYGLLRVLPGIDWELLRRHPRAYVGYSDLTPLLLEVTRRLGLVNDLRAGIETGQLVAWFQPVVELASRRPVYAEAVLALVRLDALAGRYPAEQPFTRWLREPTDGQVRGTLLGGCLSLLTATLGTPFAPDLDGGIVFWEDVNEPPYKLDRMLTHLGLSGNLKNIAGMIVGHVGEGQDPDGEPVDWPALIADGLARFSWPLAWGLESGHAAPNRTLPVGLPARLDAEARRLVLGED